MMKRTDAERLYSNTKLVGECMIWQGAIRANGYGLFWSAAAPFPKRAHRISYEIANKVKLNSSQHVCHTCDNRACINPAHLFLGNAKININDARVKGRLVRKPGTGSIGALHPKTFLADADVLNIRASNLSTKALAEAYGAHINTIKGIRSKRTWKHV